MCTARLKRVPRAKGMSLSDFIKRELERTAARPSMQERIQGTRRAKIISSKLTPAQAICELRDSVIVLDASVGAAYIPLAEETNSVLYTSDAKLSEGHRADVVLFT